MFLCMMMDIYKRGCYLRGWSRTHHVALARKEFNHGLVSSSLPKWYSHRGWVIVLSGKIAFRPDSVSATWSASLKEYMRCVSEVRCKEGLTLYRRLSPCPRLGPLMKGAMSNWRRMSNPRWRAGLGAASGTGPCCAITVSPLHNPTRYVTECSHCEILFLIKTLLSGCRYVTPYGE